MLETCVSGKNIVHNVRFFHASEPLIESLILECELFVIDPERV